MRRRYQPGQAGLARKGTSLAEAAWVENMDLERDGTYRPRWGLQWIGTFSGAGNYIGRPAGYNNHVLVIAESGKLIDVPTESFAGRTTVDTGWPTDYIAAALGVTTSGTNLWCAHKASIGGTAGALYLYNNAILATPTTAPRNGNYLGAHSDMLVSLKSGVGDNEAMAHATRGDANDWPTSQRKTPIRGCGTTDAIMSLSPTESLVFGPSGIGVISGPDDFTRTQWKSRWNCPVATPMHHVCQCRDRVFFLAPGPSVCCFDPGGGGYQDIAPPLGQDLWNAQAVTNFRTWYDALKDEFVLWDNTSFLGWRYSLKQNRWVGILSYGSASVNILGQAIIDQGASAANSEKYPLGKGFVLAGARLQTWDHSLFTDQTGSGTSSTYTCAIETAEILGDDPGAEKQMPRIQIDGAGTLAALKLKHRNTPDGSLTTVTLASNLALPAVVYPSSLPHWRGAFLRLEWASASTVRFRSVEVDHPAVSNL